MVQTAIPSVLPEGCPSNEYRSLRLLTATSLFDGHDVSINIMRRMLQNSGVEVIHLGHNRSVAEIVNAAIQEDVQGIAVSSYQGGHLEFFKYLVDQLREIGSATIQVFGGGGGVIVPEEIKQLHGLGVARVYSPEDGQKMGLKGLISDIIQRCTVVSQNGSKNLSSFDFDPVIHGKKPPLAKLLTRIENGSLPPRSKRALKQLVQSRSVKIPVVGVTGTGGSGKSCLIDELIHRFRIEHRDTIKIALIAIDPTRRKTGGALLGDRLRMNSIHVPNIFMRSMATRGSSNELPRCFPEILRALQLSDFDLIMVETPGIGQSDAAIIPHVSLSLYVMTPEFGAASQLEKIEMLDHADLIAVNKFDVPGAADALRAVCRQLRRNREAFDLSTDQLPIYGTVASRWNDEGVNALYRGFADIALTKSSKSGSAGIYATAVRLRSSCNKIIPAARQQYLSHVANTVHAYRRRVAEQVSLVRERYQLMAAKRLMKGSDISSLDRLIAEREHKLDQQSRSLLSQWTELKCRYAQDEFCVSVTGTQKKVASYWTSLSGTKIPKVALPAFDDEGELLKWLYLENVPGEFPYTAGVFPFKREDEEPVRMFAGEGDPFRTNRRFHFLCDEIRAKRLSIAFDSVTLYGKNPDERPDIYGKIGNSGVSVATLDDMKALFEGFDLCDPATSVSMTINGPAPIILAMFFNAAIDQQVEVLEKQNKRLTDTVEREKIKQWVLARIRGTVQADILKEDQGQNTCLFGTEFSLKLMGDVEEYFARNGIQHFYSASVSGYHIGEAGANPITQLAFTLANGFTYIEAFLARGLKIDEFAHHLSFFFSTGMEPEYSVLGRVARRIWAITLKDRYGASDRGQKLKYHMQTSGRSLHAQESDFNEIRTSLEALAATYDNCNSLHTNASDEAVTIPTEATVRRALAVQLIINREWGLAKNENPNQGAFIIEQLTHRVEEAVLHEFDRLSARGDVLGAMETAYQRGKIQDESITYEHKKHDGTLPLVGVNTFLDSKTKSSGAMPLARSTREEKDGQIARLREFHNRNAHKSKAALDKIKHAAIGSENVFSVLMDSVRHCSLGQITAALFEVGGQYRRNM